MRHLPGAAVALGVAGLVVVGGGAYALGSSSGGTVTVCVSHKTRALYKRHKCAKHDKKLTWNKQGIQGIPGPKGDTGATGPSDVYYNRGGTVSIPADPSYPTGTPTTVLTLTVPAGSYWLSGKMFAYALSGPAFSVNCSIVNGASIVDDTNGEVIPPAGNTPFAFAAPLTVSSATTLDLRCDSLQAVGAFGVKLAAIKTQNLNASP